MITILADGVQWPVETFLDAYRFARLDWRSDMAIFETDLELEVVLRDGERAIVKRMIARHVDRHDCLAIKGADGNALCEGCGLPFEPAEAPIYASEVANRRIYVVNSFEVEFCTDCQSEGEWEY